MQDNALYCGDCLQWMRRWEEGGIDLVYLDPPFRTQAHYLTSERVASQCVASRCVASRRSASRRSASRRSEQPPRRPAFHDLWRWDEAARLRLRHLLDRRDDASRRAVEGLHTMLGESALTSYLTYLAERLEETRRLLSPTGSLYLHCDPRVSHYLKVLLDAMFGQENFRNEIVWHYQTGGASKSCFAKKHDILLFYSKTSRYRFYASAVPFARTEKALLRARHGRGARIECTNRTKLPMDVWSDIAALNPMSKERVGYPTQKPLALLTRIVRASSREGDVVLDPFCGCGTTLQAARDAGRRWIGIDASRVAIETMREHRFKDWGMPVFSSEDL